MLNQTELTVTDALGHPVSLVVSAPTRARSVVILSHGFRSNKDSATNVELQDRLYSDGIASIRYDYYGHGPAFVSSPGRQISKDFTLSKAVTSLHRVVRYCREQGFAQVALFGSSFGGLVSLVAASLETNISAVCLRAPVTDPVALWGTRLSESEFQQWRERGVLNIVEDEGGFELNYGFWEDLSEYKTEWAREVNCPIITVHGDRDSTVPIEQSFQLAKSTGAAFHVVHGADHRCTDPAHFNEMIGVVVQFLQAHMLR